MKEPIQAIWDNRGSKGGTLYVKAPKSYNVSSSLSSPYALNMLPGHNGTHWVVTITPSPEQTQLVDIYQDGEQRGFVSFRYTSGGPDFIRIIGIEIKHKEFLDE